jgi:post-segregation antitoxin (ccd killing protein)
MNTLKTTMSKIAQIEQPERTQLAKHEVELTLVDDIKKALNEFNKVNDLDDALRTKYAQLKQDAKNIVTQCENSKKLFLSIMSKFEASAKDLGINVDSSIEYGIAKENVKIADAIIKNINTLNLNK